MTFRSKVQKHSRRSTGNLQWQYLIHLQQRQSTVMQYSRKTCCSLSGLDDSVLHSSKISSTIARFIYMWNPEVYGTSSRSFLWELLKHILAHAENHEARWGKVISPIKFLKSNNSKIISLQFKDQRIKHVFNLTVLIKLLHQACIKYWVPVVWKDKLTLSKAWRGSVGV